MADAYTLAAGALVTLITSEFSAEGVVPLHDKLHESVGLEGSRAGVSPTFQAPNSRDGAVKETYILVQFYAMWEKLVDPTQQVDPRTITAYADRFERALEAYQASASTTPEVWYFALERLDYPDDPTGNKTRFEAVVKATGDNTALQQRL